MANFLQKLNEEFNIDDTPPEELKKADHHVKSSAFLSKLGTSLMNGWESIKSWSKAFFTNTLKTLGIGVAITKGGKFQLFDKDGTRLLARDADSVKVNSDLKLIKVEENSSNEAVEMQISSTNFLATKITPQGAAIFNFNIKENPVNENKFQEICYNLSEGIMNEDAMDPDSFGALAGDEEDTPETLRNATAEVHTTHLEYKDFIDVCNETYDKMTKSSQVNQPKVITVVGDSGIGKTQIIKRLAEQKGANFFYMELGKIDKSLITGIPIATKVNVKGANGKIEQTPGVQSVAPIGMYPSEGEEDISLDPDTAVDGIMNALDSGAGEAEYRGANRKWIIFFDEFNRAHENITSVIMNLFIDGKIVSAIKQKYNPNTGKLESPEDNRGVVANLPKGSVIFVAMNTQNQTNLAAATQVVHGLDIATASRLSRSYVLKSTYSSWQANFAGMPTYEQFSDGTTQLIYPRIPYIVSKYMKSLVDAAKAAGSGHSGDPEKAPFDINLQIGDEQNTSAMDPRRWTSLGAAYYENAMKEWQTLSKEKKESYLPKAKQYLNHLYSKPEAIASEGSKTKVADLSLSDMNRIISKLKSMDPDEAAHQLLFTAFANTSFTRMAQFLNSYNVAGAFGTGVGDSEEAAEEDIKNKMTDIMQFIEKTQANWIDPKDLFLGYTSAKSGKDKKLVERVKNIFGVDPRTGDGNVHIDTIDFTDQLDAFLASFNIGEEKQIENVNGKQMSGNWRVAADILYYIKLDKNSLSSDFELTPKARKALEASKNAEGLAKQADFIYGAVYQVAENLLSIFKDFSRGAGDVMEAVIKTLSNPRFNGSNFSDEFEDAAFDKPFAQLILQVLNSQGDVRSTQTNVTSRGKEKSAANRFNDDEEENSEEQPQKRHRRTKAEMEAAKSGNAFANFRNENKKTMFDLLKDELLGD